MVQFDVRDKEMKSICLSGYRWSTFINASEVNLNQKDHGTDPTLEQTANNERSWLFYPPDQQVCAKQLF